MSAKNFYFHSWKELYEDFDGSYESLLKFMYSFRKSSDVLINELVPAVQQGVLLNSDEIEEKITKLVQMHTKDSQLLLDAVNKAVEAKQKTINRNTDPTNRPLP